jgi:ABC-type uncharacterized transport system substrate-binding protein
VSEKVKRREFITLLGGAAAVWPLAARAQQPAMPVVGFLNLQSLDALTEPLRGFRQGLKETGYIEGENVAIEYRWADNQIDRLPALAAELVRRQVAVIAAIGGVNSALAAKAETSELPIIFLTGRDPVELGFVESYNRPGGNLTGVSMLNDELVGKRLELLRELVPKAATIATLINPDNRNHASHVKTLETVARAGGQQVIVIGASADTDFEPAFAILIKQRADALVINADPFLDSRQEQMVGLARRHGVPTISPWREFVQVGGLASYGTSLADAHRQVGVYAGRILKGAKPADLPVVQPTKFEMFINLKTASALGLTVPASILMRADEVIE